MTADELQATLACWHWVGRAGLLLVALGCLGEGYEYFTSHPADETFHRRVHRWSLVVLLIGLALEGAAEWKESALEAQEKSPRKLTKEQISSGAAALSRYKGLRADVGLSSNPSVDGPPLAGQVLTMLAAAEWKPMAMPEEAAHFGGIASGVRVLTTPHPRSKEAGDALVGVLRHAGISAAEREAILPLPPETAMDSTDPYITRVLVVIGARE